MLILCTYWDYSVPAHVDSPRCSFVVVCMFCVEIYAKKVGLLFLFPFLLATEDIL